MSYTKRPRQNPEERIHLEAAGLLRLNGVLFTHPPNGSKAAPQYRAKLARLGVSKGVPDLLIFDPPPRLPECHGAALELKAPKGRTSAEQQQWLAHLAARGWAVAVTRGRDEMLAQLRAWGYLPPASPSG